MTKKKRSFLSVLTGSRKKNKEPARAKKRKLKSKIKPVNLARPKKIKKPKKTRKPPVFKSKKQETEGQLTIDVFQTADNIIIKSTIAGVDPKDLDVSIINDMLTIRGKRSHEEKIKTEDYFYQECYWGSFSRSVILPVEVDPDKIKAKLKNGILTVTLPKVKKVQSKKIQVLGG